MECERERDSSRQEAGTAALAVGLTAWVVAIITLITLVCLGYLWPGGVPAGFAPWLGGVLMLGGLAVYGLARNDRPVRPPGEQEVEETE